MKQKTGKRVSTFLYAIGLILIVATIVSFFSSCKPSHRMSNTSIERPYDSTKTPAISWNILFKQGTTKSERDARIDKIARSINKYYLDYNLANGTNYTVTIYQPIVCICDTLLYNLGFTPINGATGSVTAPPPTKPGPGGSGDPVSNISDNLQIAEQNPPVPASHFIDSFIVIPHLPTKGSRKLAIIDSGIDTLLFSFDARRLIWNDLPGTPTLFNFLPLQNPSDLNDLTPGKHGSAVTATAIKAMGNVNAYPKIMVLKALNEKNQGSVFSVSCALSYVIQKQPDVVNMSLGYYDSFPDPILEHYLNLCLSANPSIQIFAAAGNTPPVHFEGKLCATGSNHNELPVEGRLFYPACLNARLVNITSVTQLNKPDKGCYYQNFSNRFVNLGIHDLTNCCAIRVGFTLHNPRYYEGSSFATPVASGLKMASLLQSDPVSFWNTLISRSGGSRATIDGKYIDYNPIFP